MEQTDKAADLDAGKENRISVYVANLGKYNEGSLVGGWIDLPASKEELDAFLHDDVGVETDPQAAWEKAQAGEAVYEEYAVHDFEYDGALAKLGFKPGEYQDIDDLNSLAWLVSDFDDMRFAAVAAAAETGYPFRDGALGLANLAVQVDDIPFYGYEDVPDSWSPREKLGYTLVDPELQSNLERTGSTHRYDYEGLGEELEAEAYTAYEHGYLDGTEDLPDPEKYDSLEIEDIVAQRYPLDGGRDLEDIAKGAAFEETLAAAEPSSKAVNAERSAGGRDEKAADRGGSKRGGHDEI